MTTQLPVSISIITAITNWCCPATIATTTIPFHPTTTSNQHWQTSTNDDTTIADVHHIHCQCTSLDPRWWPPPWRDPHRQLLPPPRYSNYDGHSTLPTGCAAAPTQTTTTTERRWRRLRQPLQMCSSAHAGDHHRGATTTTTTTLTQWLQRPLQTCSNAYAGDYVGQQWQQRWRTSVPACATTMMRDGRTCMPVGAKIMAMTTTMRGGLSRVPVGTMRMTTTLRRADVRASRCDVNDDEDDDDFEVGTDVRASQCGKDASDDDSEMTHMASAMVAQHRRRQWWQQGGGGGMNACQPVRWRG